MIDDVFQPVKMKLSELIKHRDNFLSSLTTKRKETVGTYERALREFVQFFPQDGKFFFRVQDVERYRKHLAQAKKMQDASIATYMTSLRRLCQYLVDIEVLEKNPATRVYGSARPKQHNRTFLTLEEVDILLNSIDRSNSAGLRDVAIIRLMLGCACSEIELTSLDVGDLEQQGKSTFLLMQGKGKSIKDERVQVPHDTALAIQDYLKSRTTTDVNGVEHPPALDSPMLLSYSNRSQGGRITIRGLREAILLRLKSSGVQKGRTGRLTPFSLRHTAGILMVEAGATVEELMTRMRIAWRPTAMLYFKQKGKLHSNDNVDSRALVSLEKTVKRKKSAKRSESASQR